MISISAKLHSAGRARPPGGPLRHAQVCAARPEVGPYRTHLHPIALTLAFALVACTTFASEPGFHRRRGLPHLAARAETGGELRVAYLGGSITAAEGWRSLATARLRELLPHTTITEINAGLPGTGSDLGVCRLESDVLRHQPDLIFVEFAVNDASTPPARVERTLEGIVRQTRRALPSADIFFVYTVSTPGLLDLQAGRLPPAAQAMERVAAHYGIPSLHFGVEVARRVSAGSLVFKGTSADGDRAFSLDGVHPTPAGHRIYFETLDRALPLLLPNLTPRPALPPPLRADNWERSGLQLAADAARLGDWTPVPLDDANLRGATKALLPPTWRAATPGSAVEFTFTGTRFGFLGIAAPDSGEFAVSIDGGAPVRGTFFDAYASPTFCRQRAWWFPETLAPGAHRARIELLATALDKAAIKADAGKPLDDPAPYSPNRLTLCGLIWIDAPAP
ncbi:MAG TPA: GDSL-type esterase/lipase family protein [Opitutaceae bacterium]